MRVDPRTMEKMMKQMGISTKTINPNKIVFEFDNEKWTISDPEVTQMTVQGNTIFQVVGNVEIEKDTSEDLKLIMEQANVDENTAREALKNANGDLAQAILSLSK